MRWVIYGELNFWFQGRLLPKSILNKARSLIYICIHLGWEESLSWRQMANDKKDGGLGLQDVKHIAKVSTVKRTVEDCLGQLDGRSAVI